MSKVQVYILTEDPNTPKVSQLKDLFIDPLFNVKLTVIKVPSELTGKSEIEYYKYTWVLNNSYKEHSRDCLIILKDNSVSNCSAPTVTEIIKAFLEEDFDIAYLCKWLDRCDLYQDPKNISTISSDIVTTKSPQGTQALMFSPKGRDILLGRIPMRKGGNFRMDNNLSESLNTNIFRGNILAKTVITNVIDYDISMFETEEDLNKLNQCEIPKLRDLQHRVYSQWWGWLLIIILAVLVGLIIFYIYNKRLYK